MSSWQYWSVYLSSYVYFLPLEYIYSKSYSSILLFSSVIKIEKTLSPSYSSFRTSNSPSMPMSVSSALRELTFTPSFLLFRYSAST